MRGQGSVVDEVTRPQKDISRKGAELAKEEGGCRPALSSVPADSFFVRSPIAWAISLPVLSARTAGYLIITASTTASFVPQAEGITTMRRVRFRPIHCQSLSEDRQPQTGGRQGCSAPLQLPYVHRAPGPRERLE